MNTEEQEEHVQACLSKDAPKIHAGGIRYVGKVQPCADGLEAMMLTMLVVVYKLTPSSTLIGQECVICFEEFESGK